MIEPKGANYGHVLRLWLANYYATSIDNQLMILWIGIPCLARSVYRRINRRSGQTAEQTRANALQNLAAFCAYPATAMHLTRLLSRLNEVMLTMVPRSKLDQAQDDLRVLKQTCDGLSVDLDAAKHEMTKMATSHHQRLEALSNQLDSARIEITRFPPASLRVFRV